MGRSNWANWAPTVSGPLTEYAPGYQQWLVDRGFTPEAKGVAARVWQLGQLSRWLEAEGLAPGQLTSEQVARFVAPRRAAGRHHWVSPLSLRLPLAFLREAGVVPDPAPSACEGPLERLVDDYRRYLAQERGVTEKTIKRYERVARLFLGERAQGGSLDLERLTAADVTGSSRASARSAASRGARAGRPAPVVALSARGGVDRDAVAVGGAAGRGSARRSLPRGLDSRGRSCWPVVTGDVRSAARDYAILLLMARLGVARRRGGRADARGCRLARAARSSCTARARGGSAAAAGRCRRGARVVSAPPPAAGEPGAVLAGPGAPPARSRGRRRVRGDETRASAPGCRRSGRTACGTPPRPGCSMRALRWLRSGRCCAIGTRRTTAQLCQGRPRRLGRWRCRGREVRR